MTRRTFWLLLSGVLTLALALRLVRLGLDVFSDEAWYFHLARTLGLSSIQVSPPRSPLTHLLLRPVAALFFWPWAQLGLTAARVVNILLGVATVAQVALLLRRLGRGPVVAGLSAGLVAVHYVSCHMSAFLYPDTLATLLCLVGVRAFLDERPGPTFAALLLAVLAKEMVAPVLLALLVLSRRRALTIAVAAALVPVVAVNIVAVFVLGARPQGWATEAAGVRFWTAQLVPALAVAWPILARARRFPELALSLAFPIFFVLWAYVRRGGVAYWYVAAAVPFAAIAIGSAGDVVARWVRERLGPRGRAAAWVALAAACLGFAVPSIRLALRWGDRSVLDALGAPRETERVAAVVAARAPRELVLVDCFWAFAWYPFGPLAGHVTSINGVAAPDLGRADVVVYSRPSDEVDRALASCRLLRTADYGVYACPR